MFLNHIAPSRVTLWNNPGRLNTDLQGRGCCPLSTDRFTFQEFICSGDGRGGALYCELSNPLENKKTMMFLGAEQSVFRLFQVNNDDVRSITGPPAPPAAVALRPLL